MSIQLRNKRSRAQSAKPTLQMRRNLQQYPKTNDKNDFLQKVYNQIPHLHDRPLSGRKKLKTTNIINSHNNISSRTHKNMNSDILMEQNMMLKKRNNQLEEELLILNNKYQNAQSKKSKKNNNINIHFQNQNLWNGNNAYMVTGVKNQYENLKLKLKHKNDELNLLRNQVQSTVYLQLKKQNQILKQENVKLIQNLLRQQNRNRTFVSSKLPNYDYKALELLSEQLRYKNEKLSEKLANISKRQKQQQQLYKQQQIKIKFLQKLIIQKDNQLHSISKKLTQNDKTIITKNNQNLILKNQLKQIQYTYQMKISKSQQIQEQRRQKEKSIFQKIIKQKQINIIKLQKQIAYLTTLMSYWKPIDQDSQKQSILNNNKSQKQKQANYYQNNKSEQSLQNHINLPSNRNLNQKPINLNQILANSLKQSSLLKVNSLLNQPQRTQKRADKKKQQNSQKTRVVKNYQVQQIGEIIKYRLIAQRIQSSRLNQYLSHKYNSNVNEQENKWLNQYINIKQCTGKLLEQPFNLSMEQSRLLSRYLVEDVVQDFVFFSEQNQNKRRIIESILKNLIGEYKLSRTRQTIQRQAIIEVQKYKSKVSTILQQMYPEGQVSKRKLVQIFVGCGFEIPEQIMDYILGRIVMKSQNLSNLKYKILF